MVVAGNTSIDFCSSTAGTRPHHIASKTLLKLVIGSFKNIPVSYAALVKRVISNPDPLHFPHA
jgi:hypothetical protein